MNLYKQWLNYPDANVVTAVVIEAGLPWNDDPLNNLKK